MVIYKRFGYEILEKRNARDSLEFQRVINLSDAVFAIAMTLLVLTLNIPDVSADKLGQALTAQFAALALSFSLVAMIWWQHHSHMAMLKEGYGLFNRRRWSLHQPRKSRG